jgi:hypothetical protein
MTAACFPDSTFTGVPAPCGTVPFTYTKTSGTDSAWPKLNEGEVYAFEYRKDKNKTQAQIERKIKKDDAKKFADRYAIFNEVTKKYEVSALKAFFGEDVKPKADWTNDGKLIISDIKIPIPDLAHEYKDKYDRNIKALKHEHAELVKSYCAPNKWALYGPVAIVSAVLLVTIGIIIYQASRSNTPTPTPTPTPPPTQDNGWSTSTIFIIILCVIIAIGVIGFFVWFYFFRNKD